MFGVTCTCSWLELFVVILSWVKNDAAPFLGVGGLVGGYNFSSEFHKNKSIILPAMQKLCLQSGCDPQRYRDDNLCKAEKVTAANSRILSSTKRRIK